MFIYLFMMSAVPYMRTRKKIFILPAIPNYILSRITATGAERYSLYHISLIPWQFIRKILYRGLGVKMEKKVTIHFKTEIRAPYKLSLKRGCIIGDNAILDARNGLTIGQNANLSSNVSIYTEQHNHRDPQFLCNQPGNQSVYIGERAWLGSNVIVLPGVSVGEGAICCAGCVVTKDVEPYTVVAGIPAKKVGERPRCQTYNFNGHPFSIF